MKKTVISLLVLLLSVIMLCSCSYELEADGFELLGEINWDNANDFSEGLAGVKKDGKWGFINTDGELVIPCIYDSVGAFSEGLCAVQTGYAWNYIDTEGNVAVKAILKRQTNFPKAEPRSC